MDLRPRRAHQIIRLFPRRPHFLQQRFGGGASIHQPDSSRLAIQRFDLIEKAAQCRLIRRIAIQHFVRQRKSLRRDHQRDHHLLAVRPSIAAVAIPRLRIALRFPFHVSARQVVQQQVELGLEQIFPALLQNARTDPAYVPAPGPGIDTNDPFPLPRSRARVTRPWRCDQTTAGAGGTRCQVRSMASPPAVPALAPKLRSLARAAASPPRTGPIAVAATTRMPTSRCRRVGPAPVSSR